jgi:hypothetical protein
LTFIRFNGTVFQETNIPVADLIYFPDVIPEGFWPTFAKCYGVAGRNPEIVTEIM